MATKGSAEPQAFRGVGSPSERVSAVDAKDRRAKQRPEHTRHQRPFVVSTRDDICEVHSDRAGDEADGPVPDWWNRQVATVRGHLLLTSHATTGTEASSKLSRPLRNVQDRNGRIAGSI